jgi:hypothetical protein
LIPVYHTEGLFLLEEAMKEQDLTKLARALAEAGYEIKEFRPTEWKGYKGAIDLIIAPPETGEDDTN